uniref:Uncharacterized protein n=1 Tax=viral metagenome TaxID=1070528 RepID=A0A6C0CFA6_9ZZZZ
MRMLRQHIYISTIPIYIYVLYIYIIFYITISPQNIKNDLVFKNYLIIT